MRTFAYKAFITYSHEDSKAASWLQRKLETYRIPRGLVDEPSANGNRPATLKPIFRDRDELSAGSDLTNAIDEALTQSEYLVVICSPAAVGSRWMNLEISRFRKTHDDSKILCLIVGGEPFASSIPGREAEECFPPALGYSDQSDDEIDRSTIEPIAADLRPGKDGRNLAKLKIAAGLVGVGLDGLVRRDLQRRQWRLFGVAAASVTGMVIMTILSLIAIDARHDEQARRTEAEDLVEFMLSDLRERLEAVGRLDVLDAVGQETIEYYSKVTLDELPEDSLGRRARAFHLLGEVDDLRGDLDEARNAFREAYRSTGELMERQPANGERVFNHAQSVFWVGYLDWRLGNYTDAKAAFSEYRDLAGRLTEIDPNRTDWLAELGYANINMGVYTLETGSAADSADYFIKAQQVLEQASTADPGNTEMLITLAQAHAWLGDALYLAGSLKEASGHRLAEADIYQGILQLDPGNQDVIQVLLVSHRARALLAISLGDVSSALTDLEQAGRYGTDLLSLEPENTRTAELTARAYADLAEAHGLLGNEEDAYAALAVSKSLVDQLIQRDNSILNWQLRRFETVLQEGYLLLQSGKVQESARLYGSLIEEIPRHRSNHAEVNELDYHLAQAYYFAAVAHARLGNRERATLNFEAAIEILAILEDELPLAMLSLLANSTSLTGGSEKAGRLANRLESLEYRHPKFANVPDLYPSDPQQEDN